MLREVIKLTMMMIMKMKMEEEEDNKFSVTLSESKNIIKKVFYLI